MGPRCAKLRAVAIEAVGAPVSGNSMSSSTSPGRDSPSGPGLTDGDSTPVGPRSRGGCWRPPALKRA